jgi:hypothetical protein
MTGTVIPIPYKDNFWFRRSYVDRLVVDVAYLDPPALVGDYIEFRDTANVTWQLKVRGVFYAWSSNSYNLLWPIDPDASNVSIAGSPVVDGYYIDIRQVINSTMYYIWIQPGGLPGTEFTFLLPSPTEPYWRPSF